MINLKNTFIILFIFSSLPLSAQSISRVQGETLMEECLLFRVQEIAPLRDAKIKTCVNEQGNDPAYCTRFYKDYGEAYMADNGVMQLGFFWDTPLCEKALNIEKYFMLYPSKKIYQTQ